MSQLISGLLEAKEPGFNMAIKHMEEITGRQGIDVRLTAEIMAKTRLVKEQLGLDPVDTDPQELYYALINKLELDDQRFVSLIGAQFSDNPRQLLEPVVKAVGSLNIPKKCWVLKKAVAKNLLRANPPKNIMKKLHYQSVDSLLKNENIFEIYGALRFGETDAWLKRFNNNYKNIRPSDFEIRNIEILTMPEDRWAVLSRQKVNQKGHFVTNVKEMGAIIILPPAKETCSGYATLLALLLVHYANEIRAYSSFFKLQQVKPDFSKLMANTLNKDEAVVAEIGGQALHWRVVQRHIGKQVKNQPQIFEPHLQWEDLKWHKAEKTLAKIDPALGWWQDLDYIGCRSGNITISFNILDVMLNFYHKREYKQAESGHLKMNLWNELFSRYMGEQVVEQQILRQLNIEMLQAGPMESINWEEI